MKDLSQNNEHHLGTIELLRCAFIGQPIDDGEEDSTTAKSCNKKAQVAKEESKNEPRVCGFVSVEEVIFRCANYSASKSMVHKIYIAIYVLDEKNHLNAFGALNVTFMVCFLM